MIIKRVSETYELIAEELKNYHVVDGMTDGEINGRTANLVVSAKEEMAEEMVTIDETIRGVEQVIMDGWFVRDNFVIARLTVYVMMLSHSLCTQEDVLIDVKKGRVKL